MAKGFLGLAALFMAERAARNVYFCERSQYSGET